MTSRRRGLRGPVAAFAAATLVVLSPGIALAEDSNPLRDLTDSVSEGLQQPPDEGSAATGTGSSGGDSAATQTEAPAGDGADTTLATPSTKPPSPSSDDDSAGHESPDPVPPDHAGAQNAELDVAGDDVIDAGQTRSTVQDDDSTTADATLLAVGGQEIEGAHADSEGPRHDEFNPLAPATDEICAGSDGEICLSVLYAEASATENGSTSHSESRTGIASADLGGALSAGLATSESETTRDQRSGRTTASSRSDMADACVSEPDTSTCQVGASLVHSEGEADSGNSPGSASRDSFVASLTLGGEEQGRIDDPMALAVPPGCPDPSLACAFLNQGETYVGDGVAGHVQDALVATILPGLPLEVNVGLGHTETLVHNDGGEPGPGPDGDGGAVVAGAGAAAGGPGQPATGDASVLGAVAEALPNTGGVWSGLLAIALLLTGAGAFFVAFSRRQVVV